MNIETLRLIVDVLNTIGANSKEAFYVWVATNYLPHFIFGVIWTIIALVVIQKLLIILSNILSGDKLRKAAGVSITWHDEELNIACDILKENRDKIKRVGKYL